MCPSVQRDTGKKEEVVTVSSFHFSRSTLAAGCLSPEPQLGFGCWGLAKKSRPQINSAIYGPSLSNCSPRDGKYCSLSKITGCCNAPKACFMAAHKCSQGEAARVGLISAPEESQSVTRVPLGNAVMDAKAAQRGRGGHFALHHASPAYPHGDTRWRAPIAGRTTGGCEAVTQL